jgi:hypothetical protein
LVVLLWNNGVIFRDMKGFIKFPTWGKFALAKERPPIQNGTESVTGNSGSSSRNFSRIDTEEKMPVCLCGKMEKKKHGLCQGWSGWRCAPDMLTV